MFRRCFHCPIPNHARGLDIELNYNSWRREAVLFSVLEFFVDQKSIKYIVFYDCQEIGKFFMDVVNSSHSYATGGTSVSEFW